jgi:hypothetical protein
VPQCVGTHARRPSDLAGTESVGRAHRLRTSVESPVWWSDI